MATDPVPSADKRTTSSPDRSRKRAKPDDRSPLERGCGPALLVLVLGMAALALLFAAVVVGARGGGPVGEPPWWLLVPPLVGVVFAIRTFFKRGWPPGKLSEPASFAGDLVTVAPVLGLFVVAGAEAGGLIGHGAVVGGFFYPEGLWVLVCVLFAIAAVARLVASVNRAEFRVGAMSAACALAVLLGYQCVGSIDSLFASRGLDVAPLRLGAPALSVFLLATVVAIGVAFVVRQSTPERALGRALAYVGAVLGLVLTALLIAGSLRGSEWPPLEGDIRPSGWRCEEWYWPLVSTPSYSGQERGSVLVLPEGLSLHLRCTDARCLADFDDAVIRNTTGFEIGQWQELYACAEPSDGMLFLGVDESRVAVLQRGAPGWAQFVPRNDNSNMPRAWLHNGLSSLVLAAVAMLVGRVYRQHLQQSNAEPVPGRDTIPVEPASPEIRQERLVELHHHLLVIAVLAWGIAPLAAAASLGLLF